MLTPEFQERFRWRDWLPWLMLLRTWEFALRGTPLACALLATLLCWGAQDLARRVEGTSKPEVSLELTPMLSEGISFPVKPLPHEAWIAGLQTGPAPADPFWPWRAVAEPLQQVLRVSSWRGSIGVALAAGLQFIVWAWLGAVISRQAVGCLTETRDSFPVALTFGFRRWPNAIGGPCLPLAASALLATLLVVLTFPGRLPWLLGPAWLIAISPVLVLIGLMAAFLVGVLLLSWPLIQSAVAVDRDCDGFNALSRVYNYVTMRPWHLAWYVLVILVTGPLVLFAAEWLVGSTVSLLTRMATIGAGATGHGPAFESTLVWWAKLGLTAFAASYFWSATGLTYVLLRRSVDGIPCDQLVPIGGAERNREPYPVVGMAAAAPVVEASNPE
jgi:hypothetical protein